MGRSNGGTSRGHRALVVAAIVAATLAIGTLVGVLVIAGRPSSSLAPAQPTQRTVAFGITAPNYTPGSDSRISLHLTGSTSDGEQVDQVLSVTPDDADVSLAPGSYQLAVTVSPLLSTGDLYSLPEVVTFEVPASGGDSQTIDGPEISFVVLPPTQVSDEMIGAARQAALDSGFSSEDADRIILLIKRRRANVSDYTGLLAGTNSPGSATTLKDGIFTVSGSFSRADRADDLDFGTTTIVSCAFTYDDETSWTASGGTAPVQHMTVSEFRDLLDAKNGLGLTIQVQDGYVVSANLSS